MTRSFGFWGRLLKRDTTLHECRHCGTTVSRQTERCPACGHDGIATYHIGLARVTVDTE